MQDRAQLQARLAQLASEIAGDLSGLEADARKALLSDFVSDLFLASAEAERRDDRRQRQAEGIAAAKARGVQFGRPVKLMPDRFEEAYRLWSGGGATVAAAAQLCGLTRGAFYHRAMRRKQNEEKDCAV